MSAPLIKIETTPDLAEQVYRALLDAIGSGALRPGQRITQDELAEQFAVSRQPVMQALRLLKKDGFVQDAPLSAGTPGRARGLQVTALDALLIAQVYQVRGALDRLAARLAAERSTRIDPALLEAGRKAARRGDTNALIDADLAFHSAIYRAADNPLIEQSAQLHWHHIRRAIGLAVQMRDIRSPAWAEHEAMAEAVAAGDVLRAERLAEDHTGRASALLIEQLQARPLAGRSPDDGQLRGRRPPR